MNDIFSRMRDEANKKARERTENQEKNENPQPETEAQVSQEVADYLGVSKEEIDNCCGNTCPHCDIFLSKAIALEELGHKHHLFMNPSQEEMFKDAQAIYRKDIKEYEKREQELMDRMR
ncbi:hypothetical protein MNBD_NITROSPINAE01-1091 [hydrothermal vent metagenome]|uniref:Uncharacterized protein n=1 Tax=hydrothermal vent metagenome TaxID=652676 RepID=A0A3B1C204_9ZZZZ